MPRIERDKYLGEMINRIGNGMIKIVTGLRRVGKSYFLGEIFYDYLISQGVKEKQIIKFDFSSQKDLLRIGEDYLKLKKSVEESIPANSSHSSMNKAKAMMALIFYCLMKCKSWNPLNLSSTVFYRSKNTTFM